jgi:hypothetical protein
VGTGSLFLHILRVYFENVYILEGLISYLENQASGMFAIMRETAVAVTENSEEEE